MSFYQHPLAFYDLLDRLAALETLRPEAIGELCGVKLEADPTLSTSHFTRYGGEASCGLFREVELRAPTSASKVRDGMLLLRAPRAHFEIALEGLAERYGEARLKMEQLGQPGRLRCYRCYDANTAEVRVLFAKPSSCAPLELIVDRIGR